MIELAAYPKPVPFSRADALAFIADPTPDVAGTFLAFVMIPAEPRIGEWRFAGAVRSLAAAFSRFAEFHQAFGGPAAVAREGVAETVRQDALVIWPQLEDGWSRGPEFGGLTHRVVFFGEGAAPHDDFGLCIVEVEPGDGESFLGREPETQRPAEWDEQPDAEDED